MDERFLTATEVCSMLCITRQTLYNWGAKGLVKPRKIGLKNLYLKSEILKKMEEAK